MKKQIFQTINSGLLMGVIALTVVCAGFYIFIKARQTTNLVLTEQNPVGGLYVGVGETLTAAKRNTLVDNVVNNGTGGVVRIGNVQICRGETPYSVSNSSVSTATVIFLKPFKDTSYSFTSSPTARLNSNAFVLFMA